MAEGSTSDAERSPIHEIIFALWRSLDRLGSPARSNEIERWGFAIHAALAAVGRKYHNHDHVVTLAAGGDPLEAIAALYHDSVYIQVDHGAPPSMRQELGEVLATESPSLDSAAQGDGKGDMRGWVVLPPAEESPTRDVLTVFGHRAGDVLNPLSGLNELASALIAAVHLQYALSRDQLLAIAACIEQTIPFRVGCEQVLHARLAALGLEGDVLEETTRRAVRFGNRDVDNFSAEDTRRFLDSTWKLLPESNPALQSPMMLTARDYRIALQKTEQFLSRLAPESVFHSWREEPGAEVHAHRIARTASNLDLAGRYLRTKLYSIGVVEAIAELTGGDVPMDYFMGGIRTEARPAIKRIEDFLPAVHDGFAADPPLHRLLAEGRTAPSPFDTGPSPLGAFLLESVGEEQVMEGVHSARVWWSGGMSASAFLATLPPAPIAAIARAGANIADTREESLNALAQRLDPA